jgi:hypothetical protein
MAFRCRSVMGFSIPLRRFQYHAQLVQTWMERRDMCVDHVAGVAIMLRTSTAHTTTISSGLCGYPFFRLTQAGFRSARFFQDFSTSNLCC